MRIVRSIILGLITLFIIAAVIIQKRDGSLERLLGRDSFKEGDSLFSYNPKKANLIIVQFDGKDAEFHKNEQGIWWAKKPWNDRMDPRAAEAIVQFSLTTRIVDVVPESEAAEGGLREFGVENSPLNVIIKGNSSLARFRLGNMSPWVIPPKDPDKETPIPTIYMKTDLYQWAGNNIFVVTGNITPLFKDGLRYLRDHRPLNLNAEALGALSRIDIKSDDTQFSLKREIIVQNEETESPENEGQSPSKGKKISWTMTGKEEYQTDPQMVNNLLGVLQRLTALKVDNPDEVTILQKDSPLAKHITLNFDNGAEPVTLTIYPPEKDKATTVLATVSDRSAVFTLPVNRVDESIPCVKNIILEPKLLRSRQLVNLDRKELNGISIRSADVMTPILVKKNESGRWVCSLDGSDALPVHEPQLFNLLKTLDSGKVSDFATDNAVDLDPYGLNSPIYTLTFGFESKDPISIFIGKGVDNKYYTMVNDDPHVYELSSAYIEQLGLQPHKWKGLQLFNFNSSELKSIIQTEKGKAPTTIHYDFALEQWTVLEGDKDVSSDINPHKANNMLDNLEKAKILQWLGSSNQTAREALRTPSHRMSIITEPTIPVPGFPTISETIEFAPFGQGSIKRYFGQKMGDSDYFIIDGDTLDQLYPNLKETLDDDR